MSEPTNTVVRVAKRLFGERAGEVLSLLSTYEPKTAYRDTESVHLAVLKLSEGDFDKLEQFVRAAQYDFRDVLAWAASPNSMALGPVGPDVTSEQAAAARKLDAKQYETWLESILGEGENSRS